MGLFRQKLTAVSPAKKIPYELIRGGAVIVQVNCVEPSGVRMLERRSMRISQGWLARETKTK
jgi:hypothetical protein